MQRSTGKEGTFLATTTYAFLHTLNDLGHQRFKTLGVWRGFEGKKPKDSMHLRGQIAWGSRKPIIDGKRWVGRQECCSVASPRIHALPDPRRLAQTALTLGPPVTMPRKEARGKKMGKSKKE